MMTPASVDILRTLVSFAAVLTVLVLAHELGHFIAARRAGIRVREFGIGLPPRLVGIRRGGTLYSVNLLPLGGFVRMQGENSAPGDPQSFASKTRSQRAMVLVAGSVMNLLLAPLLFAAAFMAGDVVPVAVEVRRVVQASPAERAGLQVGDIVLRIGNEPIRRMEDVRREVQSHLGRPLSIVVRRGERDVTLSVVPRRNPPAGQGSLGISMTYQVVTIHRPPWEALPLGIQRTGELLGLLVRGLEMIASRQIEPDVAGPVGIARLTGEAASAGLTHLLHFTGFLSINLALLNMLPIPGLDGGRLAFVALEGIRGGRRLSPALEGAIHMAGLMLLITLVIYISIQDFQNIVQPAG